jgi:hypothetical protein
LDEYADDLFDPNTGEVRGFDDFIKEEGVRRGENTLLSEMANINYKVNSGTNMADLQLKGHEWSSLKRGIFTDGSAGGPSGDIERYKRLVKMAQEIYKKMNEPEVEHLKNPEGLLFQGTTGATFDGQGGGGTFAATGGATGLAPYVGTQVPRSDSRIRSGSGDEIVGHMTKAWAMTFPDGVNNENPAAGFSSRKLSKASDTAKVRPIRLVRADCQHPTFSSNGFIDSHARLWYIPYVFNSGEESANPEINKNHIIYPLQGGITAERNIFDAGFTHRDHRRLPLGGSLPASDPASGASVPGSARLGQTTPNPNQLISYTTTGCCETFEGYTFQTERYKCLNYYIGDFKGEGTRCKFVETRGTNDEELLRPETAEKYYEEYLRPGGGKQRREQTRQSSQRMGTSNINMGGSSSQGSGSSSSSSSPPSSGSYGY